MKVFIKEESPPPVFINGVRVFEKSFDKNIRNNDRKRMFETNKE